MQKGCLRRPYKYLRKEEKQNAKEKRKDISIRMHSSKEQQGQIRKPFSVINAKKQRKTIEWEKLDRDLFKKIRYTKGTFHAKMSTIKDRNGKDLIEVEEIKKRWQEDTEEKGLNELDNHDGVITHLEPDIL